MPQRSQPINNYYASVLDVGPFGGVDPTTPPFYVAPQNFVDSLNFVPNIQYGGYATVQGRIDALAALLPSQPYGITKMERPGQADVYIFACNNADGTAGELYAGQLGGTPTALSLPESLTPSKETYFAASLQWIFLTNGTDTPLKIDTDLNVTLWGIVAPTPAPTAVTSGAGVLLGQYYYCETFSDDVQESSQGAISAAITAAASAASGTVTIGGSPTAGDGVGVNVNGIPSAVVVTSGQSADDVAAALAAAVNANTASNATVVATVVDNVVTLTSAATGLPGNDFTYVGAVTAGAGTTIAPTSLTHMSGGTAGQSITITPSATTTDPQVTTRNLYRLGGSLGQWRLIHSAAVDDLTPYLDDNADATVTGQQLVIFRDPPPAFAYITTHQERIWGFGTPDDPSQLWWSNYGEPWGFNPETQYVPVGENSFGDYAVGLASIGSILVVHKKKSTYAMYGQSDTDWDVGLVCLYPDVGCVSARSIASAYSLDAWLSVQGAMLFDGSQRTVISDGNFQVSNIKDYLDAASYYDKSIACGFWYDRMYYISLPSLNKTYTFDLRQQAWYPLGFGTERAYYDLEAEVPVVAMNLETPGQIDRWFAPDAVGDLGNDITAYILSRVSDAGAINVFKAFRYLFVEAPLQVGTLNFYVYFDGGAGVTPWADTIDLAEGAPRHRRELPMGAQGTQVQMKLQTIGTSRITLQKASIFGMTKRINNPESPSDG